MRKKLLMVGLLFTLIFTLNGCYSDDPQPSSSVAEVPNSSFSESTESINETVKTEPIDNCQDTVSDDTTQEETEYKNGVATFKDVLISGSTPYTLDEVDTAIRYVVPDSNSLGNEMSHAYGRLP